jgi:hypothetical protein
VVKKYIMPFWDFNTLYEEYSNYYSQTQDLSSTREAAIPTTQEEGRRAKGGAISVGCPREEHWVLFWRKSAPIECRGGTGHPVYRVLAVKDHRNLEIDNATASGTNTTTKRFR